MENIPQSGAPEQKIYRTLSAAEYGDIESRILYEDNHVLVFNKRVGEIVQGDKTGDEPVSEMLKAFIAQRDDKPGRVFMGVPHRLDRPVSGICMFAKTSKALERLNEAFRVGGVDKIYWALVCDRPNQDEAELIHFMTRNEKQNRSYAYPYPRKDSKEAKLRYRFLKATDKYYLLEVTLLTGRHHQIRCQLSAIGCPIKGDLKYGAPRSNKNGGISLHARRLTFTHPVKKERIEVEAPLIDWPKGIEE